MSAVVLAYCGPGLAGQGIEDAHGVCLGNELGDFGWGGPLAPRGTQLTLIDGGKGSTR
ncbi:MAG: hypothetical protein ACM3ML_33515 [Micromonosporaceae bacterium]